MTRGDWASQSDAVLLAQCAVDTYRASGPGGQKRNKTSSAVRLRHRPSGLAVIAEESRSQHENKARALRRLRERLWLELREPVSPGVADQLVGFLAWSRKDSRRWMALGFVLDLLVQREGRISEVAADLGISTGQLVDFLLREEAAWVQANQYRRQFGHKALLNQ